MRLTLETWRYIYIYTYICVCECVCLCMQVVLLKRFYMMTSSNGNIFRVTGHLCGEFPTQRPVTRSFDVFFDLRLNKWLSKQPWGWWFETLLCPLWRHSNDRLSHCRLASQASSEPNEELLIVSDLKYPKQVEQQYESRIVFTGIYVRIDDIT